jgi:hypothetical protein
LDTDVMLTRDPYPFLKARTRAHAKALSLCCFADMVFPLCCACVCPQSAPLSRFSLVAQREQPQPPGLNIGVMYARAASASASASAPPSAVAWLLNETVRRAASTLGAQPPLARWDGAVSRGPKEVLWDQYILNDAAESAAAGATVVRRAGGRLRQHGEARDAWEVRSGIGFRMLCSWHCARCDA